MIRRYFIFITCLLISAVFLAIPKNNPVKAQTSNPGNVVVVSPFSLYPSISQKLTPLINSWQSEGRNVVLIDIADIINLSGRDLAEKLRNKLKQQYQLSPFKYLFLIDIQYPTGQKSSEAHRVPARIFIDTDFVDENFTLWNDYYFSDLEGTFDTNQDGIYAVNYPGNDYSPGNFNNLVSVGRLLLEEAKLDIQLEKYVNSDLIFRQNPNISHVLLTRHDTVGFRGSSSTSWPLGNQFEQSQTFDQALKNNNLIKNELTASQKDIVLQNLENSNMAFFWGHGSPGSQQINASENIWLYIDDLRNINLHYPLISFFQGCNTGDTGFWLVEEFCLDQTVCSSIIPIAARLLVNENPNSLTGIISIAGSTYNGNVNPVDFADMLEAALWKHSLSQSITEKHWKTMAPSYKSSRSDNTDIYFGDPTLPFPGIHESDIQSPKIYFNQLGDTFAAIDTYSGVDIVQISWDNEPFHDTETIISAQPMHLPGNKVFYENHDLAIKATDRAGNTTTTTKSYRYEPDKANLILKIQIQGPVSQQPLDQKAQVLLKQSEVVKHSFNDVSLFFKNNGIYAVYETEKLYNILPGYYDLYFKGWAQQQMVFPNINLVFGDNLIDQSQTFILAGDLNTDNKINLMDSIFIIKDYGKTFLTPVLPDLNLDSQVNFNDLFFILNNYLK